MSFLTTKVASWWRLLIVICVINLCIICIESFGKEPAIVLSPQVKQSLFSPLQGAFDNPKDSVISLPSPNTGAVANMPAPPGQDIGTGDVSGALLQIELQMKMATKDLRKLKMDQGKSKGEIQKLQMDIIRQLTRVIDREQMGSQSVFSETPTAGASGQEAGVGIASDNVIEEAGTAIAGAQNLTPQELAQRQLLLWNHLPPRVRTQLRDAAANPFIARYERLIEQFYLRLNQRKPLGQ